MVDILTNIEIPMESKIAIDAIVKLIKENPEKLKLIDLFWLLKQEKYQHLTDEIINLPFSAFVGNPIHINNQEQFEKEIIKLYGKLTNLSITEIQKLLGNCDRTILSKTIKFLEQKNYTGFRIKFIGKRKGRKYSLVKENDFQEITHCENDDQDDQDDDF